MPQTPLPLETGLVMPVTPLSAPSTLPPKPSSLPSHPHAATAGPGAPAPPLGSALAYNRRL
ncbi:uncharacterized protein K444DRAFT_620233 [Hyaloscypha bicolor E]|uniref:Uncharacterized protein n=1 Tax=Hyaloscypha bicolor E TaxID=1095630 RepID=A0A2J6SJV3_9HELO|nr:uncharacterized protein K444DRAFT_620233 [Hyaloscypha bicolor E]PMD51052.1 hypothetical protein K444DRAFT_620233 [Hyaloscypha bicolor E]